MRTFSFVKIIYDAAQKDFSRSLKGAEIQVKSPKIHHETSNKKTVRGIVIMQYHKG